MKDYLRIARPGHWPKNVFVLPGALFAVLLGQSLGVAGAVRLAVAVAATCLAASANYVINEWLDAGSDAFHPFKSARPAVRGTVTRRGVLVEYAILVVAAIAVALVASRGVAWMIGALLFMGVAYNVPPVRLKDRVYADVLSESVNNAIRLLIGWFAVTNAYLPPVSLVGGFWMGGAFLMAVKRLAEYNAIGDPETAARYRRSFGRYTSATLTVSTMLYAMVATFMIGIFLVKYRVEYVIAMPALWALFCWYLVLGLRKDSVAQRPESLYKETALLVYAAVLVALILGLTFVQVPAVEHLTDPGLIRFSGW